MERETQNPDNGHQMERFKIIKRLPVLPFHNITRKMLK